MAPRAGFEELPEGIAAAFGGTIQGAGSHRTTRNKTKSKAPIKGALILFAPRAGFEPAT